MNELPAGAYYTEVLPDGRTAIFPGERPTHPPGKFSRASQERWDAAHLRTIGTRVDVETARRFREACRRMGLTPYAAIKDYVVRVAYKSRPDGGS